MQTLHRIPALVPPPAWTEIAPLPSSLKSAVAGRALRLLLQEAALRELPSRLVRELDNHLRLFEESGDGCRRWKMSDWLHSVSGDVHQEAMYMNDAGIFGARWSGFYWAEVIIRELGYFAESSGSARGLDRACESVCHLIESHSQSLCNCIATEMRRLLDAAVNTSNAAAALLRPGHFLGTHAMLTDAKALNPGEIKVISTLETSLVDRVLRFPTEMRGLSPREFEQFIADLLSGLGWAVELTARTRDGGRDIIAVRSAEQRRLLVECKRYQTRPVGVAIVQRLGGVLLGDPATQGLIATTSHFSRDALEFLARDQVKWVLSGRDYHGIIDWLAEYERARAHAIHAPFTDSPTG